MIAKDFAFRANSAAYWLSDSHKHGRGRRPGGTNGTKRACPEAGANTRLRPAPMRPGRAPCVNTRLRPTPMRPGPAPCVNTRLRPAPMRPGRAPCWHPAADSLPPATCHFLSPLPLPPATCHLPPATCHLPPATCRHISQARPARGGQHGLNRHAGPECGGAPKPNGWRGLRPIAAVKTRKMGQSTAKARTRLPVGHEHSPRRDRRCYCPSRNSRAR
jgi:hypothetical protein